MSQVEAMALRNPAHSLFAAPIRDLREAFAWETECSTINFLGSAMPIDSRSSIPKIVMDTSTLPEAEQFAYWAAHSRGARLRQVAPGPFLARGDLWSLGGLQITLVDIDPFVAVRDQALVNAVEADYIQLVQLIEGAITFEAGGVTMDLEAPVSFVRDYGQPSTATSTRMRCLILYFSRDFLEEVVGPVNIQRALVPVPELDLLRDVAMDLIRFFPAAVASSAPLYATILRDLAAAALLRAGVGRHGDQLSLLAKAKAYVATQPPGSLSVTEATAALTISRSALYRLFERDGGLLAYDRRRRLRAAHRAMCNPLNTSTLAEIARRYGFRDQAALVRSFRKAFGRSPSEIREQHARPETVVTMTQSDEIREAIESIG
ncbi:helix-turn-helix domain-containing protein [Sphingomonas phyllosphaerae]|uniref:helix-turn-helix domain-containing protein n=1 Tax=Sphingomonas phyllosphaerae TaxID=257003 RepID=UPI00048B4DB6|nr:AraC family transcriptional regulator [Sphingomonas phyllosphaerae]